MGGLELLPLLEIQQMVCLAQTGRSHSGLACQWLRRVAGEQVKGSQIVQQGCFAPLPSLGLSSGCMVTRSVEGDRAETTESGRSSESELLEPALLLFSQPRLCSSIASFFSNKVLVCSDMSRFGILTRTAFYV